MRLREQLEASRALVAELRAVVRALRDTHEGAVVPVPGAAGCEQCEGRFLLCPEHTKAAKRQRQARLEALAAVDRLLA